MLEREALLLCLGRMQPWRLWYEWQHPCQARRSRPIGCHSPALAAAWVCLSLCTRTQRLEKEMGRCTSVSRVARRASVLCLFRKEIYQPDIVRVFNVPASSQPSTRIHSLTPKLALKRTMFFSSLPQRLLPWSLAFPPCLSEATQKGWQPDSQQMVSQQGNKCKTEEEENASTPSLSRLGSSVACHEGQGSSSVCLFKTQPPRSPASQGSQTFETDQSVFFLFWLLKTAFSGQAKKNDSHHFSSHITCSYEQSPHSELPFLRHVQQAQQAAFSIPAVSMMGKGCMC